MNKNNYIDKSLKKSYIFLKDPNIRFFDDGYKILHVTKYNFNRMFKMKDIFIYINYYTLNKYLLFKNLLNYKGSNDRIKNIVKLLVNDNSNKRLKIIDSILNDKYLFKIICKYYPDKIDYNKEERNPDFLNHIYVHADKIFSEINFIKLLDRAETITTFSNDDNSIGKLINTGIIKGMVSKESTLNQKKFGVDLIMMNEINKSEFGLKTIILNKKSEWNILYLDVIKVIFSDVDSDIFNFKRGTNTMKYQFIVFLCDDCLGFINTSEIQLIENKKNDKLVKIEFSKNVTKLTLNTYLKKYSLEK
jgi:hypothetical protein